MTQDSQHSQRRQRLVEMIHHFDHLLPGQAPIRDFVHHNTLHGYQHLTFPEALKKTHELTGAYGYMPREKFLDAYQRGRINDSDIETVLKNDENLEADKPVFTLNGETVYQGEVYKIALLHSLPPITKQQLTWQLDEAHARIFFQKNVAEASRKRLLQKAAVKQNLALSQLWDCCLDKLNLDSTLVHPEAMLDMDPENARAVFERLGEKNVDESTTLTHSDYLIRQKAREELDHLINQLGDKLTLAGLLHKLTGTNLQDEILPYLQRILSNWLDLGAVAWQMPINSSGLYSYWKQHGKDDLTWKLKRIPDFKTQLDSLPDDPLDAVITELQRLGIPETRWSGYLERLVLDLPGWSGMVYWRSTKPGYNGSATPVDMADYLAVRLVTEHLFARRFCREQWLLDATLPDLRGYFRRNLSEFLVRKALYNEELPEYLVILGQQIQENTAADTYPAQEWRLLSHMIWTWQQTHESQQHQPYELENHGWRLFCLAQHLGLSANEIDTLSGDEINKLFPCLDRLDTETAGFLLLQAYEGHYREEVFAAVTKNHALGSWPGRDQRPEAQIIFCMDDREEGFRRHLETINPAIETLGAAAFFGIAMNWQALDAPRPVTLCPVVITPEHQVSEVAAPGAEQQIAAHRKRHRFRINIRDSLLHETQRNLLSSTLLMLATSPLMLISLAGKTLAPLAWGRLLISLREKFDLATQTTVAVTAEQADQSRSTEHNQHGFTLDEQAGIVSGFLQTNGLKNGFSKLVVMMGHYSHNLNNPHTAVYGCGACSGKYSGPNARAFATMANNPQVRAILSKKGLLIPDDCWFIGAEHDTCNEHIAWQDMDLIPESLQADFQRLRDDLTVAGQYSAHERCRKLASAPENPALAQAAQHMHQRSLDYSQARPELGHAANAVGFVGRRHMTEGIFLDRRSFLISYDASNDIEGDLLERLLLSAGPVGAGINLEYYFSTVNNHHYGAGTKVTHNVVGLFGVMEGAASDLRTGLPQQMIEIHEPMRLLLVVEASQEILTLIYQRQASIEELVGNGWLVLAIKDPDSPDIHLFEPGSGWNLWQPDTEKLDAIPQKESWAEWYNGQHDHLGPVTIKRKNAHA